MLLLLGVDLGKDFLQHLLQQRKLADTFLPFFFILTIMSLKVSADATENE